MYYEEAVIKGILCHRGTPDGEWMPFTMEAMTTAIVALRGQLEIVKNKNEKLESCLKDIKNILIEN